jgi:hypothetical protein
VVRAWVALQQVYCSLDLEKYRSRYYEEYFMCRSIKTLRNTETPATEEEIRAAALQYVRKISGYRKPSRVNEEVFENAVEEVTQSTAKLLQRLTSKPVS